ncbi:hypothetical protein AB0D08_13245 [Kitasatospora sp. NPDC048540]|uniref:hypothetical protein n=1 Tax=unclassified Kitasatospora TaxID=2633591 RepID=UPI00053B9F07|nr:hypothetical protein [Kitasatospora sp. MBT63]
METTMMITKMTGQTVIAMPPGAVSSFGTPGFSTSATQVRDVVVLAGGGLGLDATGVCVAAGSAVSGLTVSGLGDTAGISVETGLSRDWATFAGGLGLRDERPTQAPKAAVAAAKHGGYLQVIGAGATKKQDEQQIDQVKAAINGASAIRMQAFRGPEPWRERT